MRKQDEVPEVSTEQHKTSQDGACDTCPLIQAMVERTPGGATMPLVLLLRPSRRFERMLVRELARSRRECGTHCWERLKESLPDEFKRANKGANP